jgi:phage gpG-like protein
VLRIEVKGFSKFSEAAVRLREKAQEGRRLVYDVARQWGFDALRNIRENYITGPGPNKLKVGKGPLRRETRFVASRDGKKVTVRFGNPLPYARIHEKGGVSQPEVTRKMRAWAWHKWRQTGIDLYKGIALTKKKRFRIVIPARPYLGPGTRDMLPQLNRELLELTKRIAKEGLTGNG